VEVVFRVYVIAPLSLIHVRPRPNVSGAPLKRQYRWFQTVFATSISLLAESGRRLLPRLLNARCQSYHPKTRQEPS
jgi:hypothetical protein